MDRELAQMQQMAAAISDVRLFRRSPPQPQPDDDALLLLGLALVLLTDRADMLSVMALLYILM